MTVHLDLVTHPLERAVGDTEPGPPQHPVEMGPEHLGELLERLKTAGGGAPRCALVASEVLGIRQPEEAGRLNSAFSRPAIRMVQDAQGSRVPIQRVVDVVSGYFAPSVGIPRHPGLRHRDGNRRGHRGLGHHPIGCRTPPPPRPRRRSRPPPRRRCDGRHTASLRPHPTMSLRARWRRPSGTEVPQQPCEGSPRSQCNCVKRIGAAPWRPRA